MRELFYVYEHLRNDTNEIFYVGKGRGDRYHKTVGRNKYWQNVVAKANGFTARKIAVTISETLAFQKEIERIKELKELGFKLTNLSDGGEGVSGYIHTKEGLTKMSESQIGEKGNMFGKHHPEEVKKKISVGGLGLKRSKETCRKISKAQLGEKNHQFGKKKSDETLAKMSASLLALPKVTCPYCRKEGRDGTMKLWHFDNCSMNPSAPPRRKLTEETKAKISEAHKGKKHSAEACKKMSSKALARPKLTCPHCGLSSSSNMTRWHFDNCKMNPSAPPRPEVTVETRVRMSKAHSGENHHNFGKKLSTETSARIRASLLAQPKVTCPHCSKEGNSGNMKRWHFDNCKKSRQIF